MAPQFRKLSAINTALLTIRKKMTSLMPRKKLRSSTRGLCVDDSGLTVKPLRLQWQRPIGTRSPNIKFTSADGNKRGAQPQKPVWKLPSGAPVIPKSVFEIVEKSLHRFTIHKRKEYAANACQYWTLKREARRGAALLKRLQLQMETFSSMEITRRNFAGMGPSGRLKLNRRIEFAHILVDQLLLIKSLASDIVEREAMKLESARLEEDVVDTVYFPVAKLLPLIVEKALG